MAQGHSAPFHQRYADGKHPAEELFEKVYDKPYTKFGLDNPDMRVSGVPYFIRHTPDYLTERDLVECKGVGHDQRLKVKDVEWEAWLRWELVWPEHLLVFVSDTSKNRYAYVPLELFKMLKADQTGGVKYD